jgi:hypothetical protein
VAPGLKGPVGPVPDADRGGRGVAAERAGAGGPGPEHRRTIRVVDGLVRQHATRKGYGLAVCRPLLVPRDHRAAVGLAEYARATGNQAAREAAERAAELLLAHRLFRSHRTGRVAHAEWLQPHYPPYWHYDVLLVLLVLAAAAGPGTEGRRGARPGRRQARRGRALEAGRPPLLVPARLAGKQRRGGRLGPERPQRAAHPERPPGAPRRRPTAGVSSGPNAGRPRSGPHGGGAAGREAGGRVPRRQVSHSGRPQARW